MQQQQMGGHATSMADGVRRMVEELVTGRLTKTEVLDRTYVKSGMTFSQDGTVV